jgi:hypothetical protein
MHINKLIGLSVGADLSRTPPIYRPSLPFPLSHEFVNQHYRLHRQLFYSTTIHPSVGADLSRTPPIYRPSLPFPLSLYPRM